METKFQIFGSGSSQDYDIMFWVDELPETIHERKLLTKTFEDQFTDEYIRSQKLKNKPLNGNLAVAKNGTMVDVYKGTIDECNNSCYQTYDLHKQFHPNQITRNIERDVWLKILRTARVLLSFYSRTEIRSEVKKALKGDALDKLEILKGINIIKQPPSNKNIKLVDIYKTIAFQLGQTNALYFGEELYTKEDIIKNYKELEPFLNRETSGDLLNLVRQFEQFRIILSLGLDDNKPRYEY